MDQMLGIYEITSAIREIYNVNSITPQKRYRGESFNLACGNLTLKIGHPITSIMPVDISAVMDEVLQYYRNQAGSGLSGFAGTRYQRGNGLFSNLWTKIGLPVLKFLGRQAISTGLNVASDALDGRNSKESAVDHLKTSGRNTVDYLKQLNQQSGRGVKRRKATK
ncbi:hypothetical protein B4U80_00004, partial [Leptotrombidium deliense]